MGFYHQPPENDDSVHDSCVHLLSCLTTRFDMFGILSTMPPIQCAAMHCKLPIQSMGCMSRLQLSNWWDLLDLFGGRNMEMIILSFISHITNVIRMCEIVFLYLLPLLHYKHSHRNLLHHKSSSYTSTAMHTGIPWNICDYTHLFAIKIPMNLQNNNEI